LTWFVYYARSSQIIKLSEEYQEILCMLMDSLEQNVNRSNVLFLKFI
jgi:hypothetical protein